MSDFSIMVKIAAKYLGRGELAKAEKEINAWGHNIAKRTESVRNAFAAIGVGALAAGTAIVAFAAKALGAYMEEERAMRKLAEAHRAWGDEVDGNVEREKRFADELGKRTNTEKDAIVSSMAELRMLGMRTDALEDGAKAVIAMTHAGLGEEGAARLVANAYSGNYDRLARYIPALKAATSDTERAAIVNAFLARHLAAQEGEVNTLSGAWVGFKKATKEALETVGEKLAENGVLQSALQRMSDLVEQIAASFGKWAEAGGIEETILSIEKMVEMLRRAKHNIGPLIDIIYPMPKNAAKGISQAEIDKARKDQADEKARREKFDREFAERSADINSHIDPATGQRVMGGKTQYEREQRKAERERIEKTKKPIPSPPGIAGQDPEIAIRAAKRAQEEQDHEVSIATLKGVYERKLLRQIEDHERRRDAARNHVELQAEERDHQDKMEAIQADAHGAIALQMRQHKERMALIGGKAGESEGGAESGAATAGGKSSAADESAAKTARELKAIAEKSKLEDANLRDRKQAIEKLQEEQKRSDEQIAEFRRRAMEQELELAERRMRKELQAAQEIAGMHVADFQERQRQLQRWQDITKAENDKAERLKGDTGRIGRSIRGMQGGVDPESEGKIGGKIVPIMIRRLNKEDRAFLQAQANLQAARAAIPNLAQNIKLNQNQRDALAVEGHRTLQELLDENRKLHADLVELQKMR